MNDDLRALRRYGPGIVSLWGWSLLALSGAHVVVGVAAALVGAVAGVLAFRAFIASAVVECVALLACIALAPNEQIGFVALGVVFVVAARLISRLVAPPPPLP
jgi:hypothetical protein